MRTITRFLILPLLLLYYTSCFYAATIDGIRLWNAPDNTRLVFDLDQEVSYKEFTLKNPSRLVLDISGARLSNRKIVSDIDVTDSGITNIRYSHKKKFVRIVFDLKHKVDYKVFSLKPNQIIASHRIVVDIANKSKKHLSNLPVITNLSTINTPKADNYRKFNIVIDPGHGGEDPGSMGRQGTKEKDVVLKISKYLKEYINEDKDMQAILTRDGDYYIGLYERTEKARANQADLFVSVHADGFRDNRAKGASVFTLSERGASSEFAKWIADRENASDLVGGVSLDNKDPMLATVLLDLSQTATNQASIQVANQVLSEISKVTYLHSTNIEKNRFIVLKSPDIPSLLVETGFITNPKGEHNLGNANYQRRIAYAIYKGIQSYFKTQPRPIFDNLMIQAKND